MREQAKKIWTISNVITVFRILLVPVFVAALLAPWPDWCGLDETFSNDLKQLTAAAIFIIISCTDWIDGYLARSRNEVTDFGKFMDPIADKILVASALISLVELNVLPTWVVLIILAREFIVSGIRMMAASKGTVIAASIFGKLKTVFQMIAIVLFVIKDSYIDKSFRMALGDPMWDISWVIMIIALVLTVISMMDYLFNAKELLGFETRKNKLNSNDYSPNSTSNLLEDAGSNSSIPDLEKRISTHAHSLVTKAQKASITIACAESLTGGLIGANITQIPGSSEIFKGCIVSYTNEIKHSCLGVSSETLANHGAVSSHCAQAMANGARKKLSSTISIAVTGIAGPGGAEDGKPVGTVYIGFSSENQEYAQRFEFQGTRQEVRLQTVYQALDIFLKYLED